MQDKMLTLFYKVGATPQNWWGMVRTSRDNGRTWTSARRLPDGILGSIKNKPVLLSDGVLVGPSSAESPPSMWRVSFERTVDAGQTWTAAYPSVSADGSPINAIQPSILIHPSGRLEAVGRTRSGRVFETWSGDGGRTWTPIVLTVLPNPNSGIDAVTLRDGRHLIVYNHTITEPIAIKRLPVPRRHDVHDSPETANRLVMHKKHIAKPNHPHAVPVKA
jgi:predicted neuraminidase